MSTPNDESPNVQVRIDIRDGDSVSDDVHVALRQLAGALADAELRAALEDEADDVSGFSFSTATGKGSPMGRPPIGLPPFRPGPQGICINKTTGGEDGGHCTINTDNDTDSCGIDWW